MHSCGLLLVVVLAVALRTPGVLRPLLGTFATKNCVYAMIARNWASGHAPWYLPTIDQLVGGRRGWHLTELPVPVYLAAAAWALLGGSLDVWGRSASVAWSAVATGLMYLLMRRQGPVAALAAGAALATSPISIIYGQSFMLESSVAALSILCIWANREWWQGQGRAWLGLLTLAMAVMLLTKPYMLVLMVPLAIEAWRARQGALPRWRARFVTWAIALTLSTLPAVLWYAGVWLIAAPGSPAAAHVYFSVRRSVTDHSGGYETLLQGAFYVQAVKNLCGPVLTPLGAALAILGLRGQSARCYAPWLAACLLLAAALPLKFQAMNYYYVVVLPPLCALVGLGCEHAYHWLRGQSACLRRVGLLAVLLAVLLGYVRFAWRPAFVTPEEDRMVVAAASAVRAMSHPGDRVITLHGSTLSLLYYCNREGWAIHAQSPRFENRWSEALAGGARWVVATQPEKLARLPQVWARLAELRPVYAGDGFCIYAIGMAGSSTSADSSRGGSMINRLSPSISIPDDSS